MTEENKGWFSKPISKKVLLAFFAGAVLIYVLFAITNFIYDNDMFFMIATGRGIIANGIPHTNIWTIDRTGGFIAQQWLYDVLIAVADKFGTVGFTVFYEVQFIGLLLLLNHFFNLKKISGPIKYICITAAILLSSSYVFSLRPELISLLLLLSECIALEHFRESGKWPWLLLLPVTMLFEINLHASMWPIHYAILLAYMVPAFYTSKIIDKSIYRLWKPIALAVLAMTAVMFINPYGMDGITYILKSFVADTFSYISITELQKTTFLSIHGLIIIVGIILLCLSFKFKVLESVTTNITLGFTLMYTFALRNSMFALITFAFLLREFAVYIPNLNIDKVLSKITNHTIVYYPFFLIAFIAGLQTASENTIYAQITTSLSPICEYISQSSNDDTRIFTSFDCGAYFEYKGFNNIYLDPRPELYAKAFTGSKNILADYSKYCINGYNPTVTEDNYSSYVTKEEIDTWFYSYDFDYVVFTPKNMPYLAAYMMCNDDYAVATECDNDVFLVYEKR